jgi:hypothetical protein
MVAVMTDEQFAAWWSSLSSRLTPGTTVQHWSAAKGLKDGAFVVTSIESGCLRIEGPKKTRIYQRLIDSNDFRKVLDIWDDYCNGPLSRKSVTSMTLHSTYVLSIIRWLELNSK